MPRTTTVESPGCPPLRAITFDVLGLIKVTEARSKQGGIPKVVERWGEPDASRFVLAASIIDRKIDPLLAVARKSGVIELLSPVSGDLRVSLPTVSQTDVQLQEDNIVGLHLFKKQPSRSCTLFTCTTKGLATMRSIIIPKSLGDSTFDDSPTTWNVCAAGNILCCKVDENEKYALFGGKGVEVNIWDLATHTKIWTAKSPPKNSLGIFTPTWFTSAAFLSKDDHRKFVAGTNSHQVRLYDMFAQRRPVMSFDFRETPIKAVTEDIDGNTIYIGNGSGDLASVDIRTGKLLGCFLGKCSGSIRSIARHPDLPVIASCGLDSYLRLWDIKSRQLVSAVFLKQHLTNVVFDSHFDDEEVAGSLATLQSEEKVDNEPVEGDEESPPVDKQNKKKRSKSRSLDENKEVTPKKVQKLDGEEGCSQSAKAKRAKKSQNLEDELISATGKAKKIKGQKQERKVKESERRKHLCTSAVKNGEG
ncbi:hypothetical protein R6Q57_022744 [Mikania cordata]